MPLVVAAEPLQGDEANFVCVAGAKGKVSGELEQLQLQSAAQAGAVSSGLGGAVELLRAESNMKFDF